VAQVGNERFGTDLTDVDKLLLDQFEESWVADGELADQAQNNRPKPASWSTCRQNRRRCWRLSPEARTPRRSERCRGRGDHRPGAADRLQGGVRRHRDVTGQLVPAAPGHPAPPRPAAMHQRYRAQPRALAGAGRQVILDVLHSDRFADVSPEEAWAVLLDEGTYLGSVSTFYRILRAGGEVRERRRQATHPARVKPELQADGPNQVWSWNISKLRGPAKWTYYHLYVIPGSYSRYVVGWMVASRESAVLAEKLISDTCAKQAIGRDQLTIHADRGSSMTSRPVTFLLADLGVT